MTALEEIVAVLYPCNQPDSLDGRTGGANPQLQLVEITLLRFVCKFASCLGSLLSSSCSHITGSQTYPLTSRPSLEHSWASTSTIPMALYCGTLTRACCFSLLWTSIYICFFQYILQLSFLCPYEINSNIKYHPLISTYIPYTLEARYRLCILLIRPIAFLSHIWEIYWWIVYKVRTFPETKICPLLLEKCRKLYIIWHTSSLYNTCLLFIVQVFKWKSFYTCTCHRRAAFVFWGHFYMHVQGLLIIFIYVSN